MAALTDSATLRYNNNTSTVTKGGKLGQDIATIKTKTTLKGVCVICRPE